MSKRFKRHVNRPLAPGGYVQSRTDFNPDYSSVKRDLRRIGVLAGFFILVLIALSFVL